MDERRSALVGIGSFAAGFHVDRLMVWSGMRWQAARLAAGGCSDEKAVETIVRCDRDRLVLSAVVDQITTSAADDER